MSAMTELRLETFEMLFLRILHLLAHHPDFATTQEALPDIAKYVAERAISSRRVESFF